MNTKYFKTVSILMIIFGIIGVVTGVGTLSTDSTETLAVILGIVSSLGMIAAGFIGNKASKDGDADKAPLCVKLGIGLLALTVIGIVIGFIQVSNTPAVAGVSPGLITGFFIVNSIVSLILPVLYLLGARKLGK